jgi:hypothetical protein
MPGRIVTYVHRYKPQPRKKKARPLAGSAVVAKRTRPSTRTPKTEPTAVTAPPPANDDRKLAHASRPVRKIVLRDG